MYPSENDVLIKFIIFFWEKWLVIDRKYDGPFVFFFG